MSRKLTIKNLALIIVCGLSFLLLNRTISFNHISHPQHNCRFWGMVFTGELTLEWQSDIQTHLDSLKGLSLANNDGWGIGYFVSPYQNRILPVISRGEPKAISDARYDNTVLEMTNCVKNAVIAHVRKGSSGPTGGIPNPHPFRRTSIDTSRHFDMLFAHNGTISINLLLSLIDPTYLTLNPPDYNPNFLDSDLFAIYVMQIVDNFPAYSIHQCIVIAVSGLALHLHQNGQNAFLNFVMTDGSTIWALRYADFDTNNYGLYYFPGTFTSAKWEVASQPLDKNLSLWQEIPNYSMITLVPDKPPVIYSFETKTFAEAAKTFVFENIYPNPCGDILKIRYYSPDSRNVRITLYDVSGRLIDNVFNGNARMGINETPYVLRNLSSGVYFVHLDTEEKQMTKKVIFQK